MSLTSPATLLAALENLAPLALAEPWDNVGLLVEPPSPRALRRALLTIDLTEAVLEEAIALQTDFIIAYHPPIFGGFKRLAMTNASHRVLLRAIAGGLPLYSPHTALDAAQGGVNDWLLGAFGTLSAAAPITPAAADPAVGAGRRATLATPRSLASAVADIKAWLGMPRVRVAAADGRPIRTVAVCPGAGGSLLEGLKGVDLILTGELRHHDILAHVARGTAVVLTDHTHTERGYLPLFAERLRAAVPGLAVSVAQADADPLVIT